MWRCAICETNNDDQSASCIVCGSLRADSEKLAQEAVYAAVQSDVQETYEEEIAYPEVEDGYEPDSPYDREAKYDGSYAVGGTVVRHRRVWPFLVALAAILVLAAGGGIIFVENMYGNANDAFRAGEYSAAQEQFAEIGWYRDSEERAAECRKFVRIEAGDALIAAGDFEGARAEYAMAGGETGAKAIADSWMYQSDALVAAGDFDGALAVLENVAGTNTGELEIERVKLAQGRALLEAEDAAAAREAVKDVAGGAEVVYEAYMLDAASALEAQDIAAAYEALGLVEEYADTDMQQADVAEMLTKTDALKAEIIAAEQAAAEEAARIEAEQKAAEEAELHAKLERQALLDTAGQLADAGDWCGAAASYIKAGSERGLIAGLCAEAGGLIAAGDMHYVVLSGGTASAYGSNFYGQCNVGGVNNVIQAAAGSYHSVLLRADGTVTAVGDNSYGQCDVSGWTDIVEVAAGSFHTVGLKRDGTVVSAGWDAYGQRGMRSWTDIAAVSAGDKFTAGLRRDGTVVIAGDTSGGKKAVSEWNRIEYIDCGYDYVVGLKDDGTLVAAGENGCGQCDVDAADDVVSFAAGREHTVWMKADGSIDGSGNLPYMEAGLFTAFEAGDTFTLALDETGYALQNGELYGSISAGSDTAAIRMLQQALAECGYFNGAADGRWSDALSEAVKSAAETMGIEFNGEASPELLSILLAN